MLATAGLLVLSATAAANVRVVRVPHEGLYSQAAVDAAGALHLTYFAGDPLAGDIFYVRSSDGGASFSEPVRVNSQPGSAVLLGTVRGPQMALGAGGRVHVAWMGSRDAEPKVSGRHAPMLYARMNDASDGFEPQRNVIEDRPGLDGGGSVAADRRGNVYVVWHAPSEPPADATAHAPESERRVWVVRSTDGGATFGPERAADADPAGACGCCGIRAFAADGTLSVLYRTAFDLVHRNVRWLASNAADTDDADAESDAGTRAGAGASFEVALEHPWQIGACVMSTADMASSGTEVWAAWETERQVYVARLDPATRIPSEPAAMPGVGENRKHPRLATNERTGAVLVAWTEQTGWNKGGVVRWQVLDAGGRPVAGQAGGADDLPVWSAPAVVPDPNGDGFIVLY